MQPWLFNLVSGEIEFSQPKEETEEKKEGRPSSDEIDTSMISSNDPIDRQRAFQKIKGFIEQMTSLTVTDRELSGRLVTRVWHQV